MAMYSKMGNFLTIDVFDQKTLHPGLKAITQKR